MESSWPRRLSVLLFSRWLAAAEYHFQPGLRETLGGGPFNGQQGRQAIFHALSAAIPFTCLAETGTFRGSTTEFLAKNTRVPIHSVEARRRFYHYARLRTRSYPNVSLHMGDSRSFLNRLASDPAVPKERVFFYLDAHWYADLPLRDEIATIARSWREYVIMVDDFAVPGDTGYRFDDYGGPNRLDLSYLGDPSAFGLTAFFPRLRSDQETGAKRGCVVLADELTRQRVASIPLLVEPAVAR
jgi:hypothetical protein